MGIDGFSNFLKKHCAKNAIANVPVSEFNGKILAVDIAITISVVSYVAKNETTKRKNFPDTKADLEYYHNLAPKILWRELTKFIAEGPEYCFIFDGKSPDLKKENAGRSRDQVVQKNKKRFEDSYKTFEKKKKAGMRIDDDLKKELRNAWIQSTPNPAGIYNIAKDMLNALGLKYFQSQTEAEKDCAKLAKLGIVDGVYTTDSDALTFGSPNIVRKRFSETDDYGSAIDMFEVVYLERILESNDITYQEYVDLCIAMRCDYNILDVKANGRFGPETAYKLLQKYRRLHRVPNTVLDTNPFHYQECRDIFCGSGTLEHLQREDFKVDHKHFLYGGGYDYVQRMGWTLNLEHIKAIYLEKVVDDESSDEVEVENKKPNNKKKVESSDDEVESSDDEVESSDDEIIPAYSKFVLS